MTQKVVLDLYQDFRFRAYIFPLAPQKPFQFYLFFFNFSQQGILTASQEKQSITNYQNNLSTLIQYDTNPLLKIDEQNLTTIRQQILQLLQQQKHHEMKQRRDFKIKQLDVIESNESLQQVEQSLHTHLKEEIYYNDDSQVDQDQLPTDMFQRIKQEPIMNDYMKQDILDHIESDIFVKQEPQMINYEDQQEYCFQDEVYIPDYSDYEGDFQFQQYEDYQN
ncbi:hypothetical protein pb186bvf_008151 [Paramecium bursaria]